MILRFLPIGLVVLVGMLGWVPATLAWSSKGHRLITSAALDAVNLEGLAWSKSEQVTIANASVQPDLMRPRGLPQLRAVEAPRHYLNLELLEGKALPEERWQYINLLNRIARAGDGKSLLRPDGDVTQIGTLPYALVESTQRLAAIFAQLRVRPRDRELRIMAAHQAGFVAHYAQDLCQPLHTTVHHDGRARRDGSSPHTGIHRQVDSLLQSVPLEALDIGDRQPLKPLFPAVVRAFRESHSQVDRVYDLADELADLQENDGLDSELLKLAQERYLQSVSFTADLIHTAWLLSSSVDLPDWVPQVD
jgi:hypothetical protein